MTDSNDVRNFDTPELVHGVPVVKRPIEPSEIKAGDLIRWENAAAEVAHEWRASHDGDEFEPHGERDGQHYLLERPEPAVVLPTEHALGWVKWEQGDTDLGVWSTRMAPVADRLDGVLVNRTYRSDCWNPEKVTAFTPATAVPTESLEKLRAAENAAESGTLIVDWARLVAAVRDFLASVDNANGADR